MRYKMATKGSLDLEPKLTAMQTEYLNRFHEMTHFTLDPRRLRGVPDPAREAVGLPIGRRGAYFVGDIPRDPDHDVIFAHTPPGQEVLEYRHGFQTAQGWVECQNDSPHPGDHGCTTYTETVWNSDPEVEQPSSLCRWTPSDDGTRLEWDGEDAVVFQVEWLMYLIKHFLTPWGVTVNGELTWCGENPDDTGKIIVVDSQVSVQLDTHDEIGRAHV